MVTGRAGSEGAGWLAVLALDISRWHVGGLLAGALSDHCRRSTCSGRLAGGLESFFLLGSLRQDTQFVLREDAFDTPRILVEPNGGLGEVAGLLMLVDTNIL